MGFDFRKMIIRISIMHKHGGKVEKILKYPLLREDVVPAFYLDHSFFRVFVTLPLR
jgi:hypothetical protein